MHDPAPLWPTDVHVVLYQFLGPTGRLCRINANVAAQQTSSASLEVKLTVIDQHEVGGISNPDIGMSVESVEFFPLDMSVDVRRVNPVGDRASARVNHVT